MSGLEAAITIVVGAIFVYSLAGLVGSAKMFSRAHVRGRG